MPAKIPKVAEASRLSSKEDQSRGVPPQFFSYPSEAGRLCHFLASPEGAKYFSPGQCPGSSPDHESQP